MTTNPSTEAIVVAYFPPTRHHPAATVEVMCPFGCRELTPTGRVKKGGRPRRHLHGVGPAGAVPDLGSRVSHCLSMLGRTYVLVDPNNLVPERLEIEPALTGAGLDEARRRLARVRPARDLPWGGATEVTR